MIITAVKGEKKGGKQKSRVNILDKNIKLKFSSHKL